MREVDLTQLEVAMQRGATVVDVREPMEYVQAHVPGAVPIPMGQLSARLGELDKGSSVLVICATGNRSSAMTDLLTTAGYDAFNVAGGTMAWLRSGRAVASGLR
ncbi:MAG: rhodanese-like domain-containing protein [Nocardioidaceae bacterium]